VPAGLELVREPVPERVPGLELVRERVPGLELVLERALEQVPVWHRRQPDCLSVSPLIPA